MYLSLSKKENSLEIAGKLLSCLNVDVTTTTLEKDLNEHPDYPSLLSISDVLTKYGVANISIKASVDKLEEIPLPCIALIERDSDRMDVFTIISSIEKGILNYYNPQKHSWENATLADFEKKWPSGIVLLADAGEAGGEKEFAQKRREEKRLKFTGYATFLALPLIAVFAGLWSFVQYGAIASWPVTFLLTTLMGCIVGGLLLWYELDQYNPFLKQICSAGKKVNCGAILNSKAAKIAGISWSAIGFTYFAGGLITLLIFGLVNPVSLYILSWLNILAVPYVFFSVYYQWRIAKQWCMLCVCVQGFLVLQFLITFAGGWHTIIPVSSLLSVNYLITVLFAFTTPFVIMNLLLPTYREAKQSKKNKIELIRLKHNPQIFEALLEKQKTVIESAEGLGIVLGNPNATHKIIKVCNPYCGPCATAHTPMEELLHNNPDLQIQIIFTATNDEGDTKAPPVKLLLAIAEKDNEAITKQALGDWYLQEKKDYEAFAAKYVMNGELKQQDAKVEAMKDWCEKVKIGFTPTFFVNGHQLPEIYNVRDLEYFLSV